MASGAERISEVANTFNDIKKNIQDKYDKVAGRVEKLQKESDELDNANNQSPVWIEKQKKKIQSKIDTLLKNLENWLFDQLEKAQKWMDNMTKELTKIITDVLSAPLIAMMG